MIGIPGGWEWAIVGFIALLLFGKRLPKVARALGSTIVEFRRGLRGEEPKRLEDKDKCEED